MKTIQEIRRENARSLAAKAGGSAAFAERVDLSESRVSQLIGKNPTKSIGHNTARRIEQAFNVPEGWLDALNEDAGLGNAATAEPATAPRTATLSDLSNKGIEPKSRTATSALGAARPVIALHDEDDLPGLVRIKKVRLRLSAGIAGYAADPIDEDESPISFRAAWMARRGYNPDKLVAIEIRGQSMEPGLYDGDTVVINTADTLLRDGEVYAVNYEGEAVVKRLVREMGSWWLVSDSPDQRRFPRKQCAGDMCLIIGRVIHKQSERI